MIFEDLKSPELQEKLRACKTPADLAALAKEQGVELSDDQLESLSGGGSWLGDECWVWCGAHMPDGELD